MSMSENFCSLSMSVYRALDLAGINLEWGFPLQLTQKWSNLLSDEFAFDFLKIIAGKVKVEAYLDTLTTCMETSFGKEKSLLNPLLSRKINWDQANNIQQYVQIHSTCSSRYCLKDQRGGCRFGFPKHLKSRSKIRLVDYKIPHKFFPSWDPSRNNPRLIPTNLVLSTIMLSNTDVQAVCSRYYLLSYV